MDYRKKISLVLVFVLILILIGICILFSYMKILKNDESSKLNESHKELEAEIASYESEIVTLEEQIQELQGAIEEKDAQIAELKGQVEEMTRINIADLEPGTIVEMEQVEDYIDDMFQQYEIVKGDDVYNRIYGKSFRDNNDIGLEDLRYLKMLHYNFNHQLQVGEMIVNAAISEDVIHIFKELFDVEYEVESMYLIDNYWTGDGGTSDSASIDENNTSAFCYRVVTGGAKLSNHAYGRAIDINPQQNPYVYSSGGTWKWSHENATPYIDRECGDPHVIVKGDVCYSIFEKYGFSWGGNWGNPLDYQHFEKES